MITEVANNSIFNFLLCALILKKFEYSFLTFHQDKYSSNLPMNICPDEVLAYILSFIENIRDVVGLSQTSKRWRMVIADTNIETPVDISYKNYNLVFEKCHWKLTNITISSDHIQRFFPSSHEIKNYIFRQVGERYPLRTIDLSHCYDHTDNNIDCLINSTYGKFIQNIFTGLGLSNLTNKSVGVITKCTNLQSIKFNWCSKLTDDINGHLINCNYLHNVTFTNCARLTDNAFVFLKKCRRLQNIILSGCKKLTDTVVVEYLINCHELQHVEFSQCRNMTNNAIITLVKHCPKIKTIIFANCGEITNDIFESLRECQYIEVINFSCNANITDYAFSFVSNYTKLQAVDFSECVNLTDDALEFISNCSQLQRLIFRVAIK